jgi:hypothetical protein
MIRRRLTTDVQLNLPRASVNVPFLEPAQIPLMAPASS